MIMVLVSPISTRFVPHDTGKQLSAIIPSYSARQLAARFKTKKNPETKVASHKMELNFISFLTSGSRGAIQEFYLGLAVSPKKTEITRYE
jgi:hypothetical protein